jgi:hypothetical protein
MAINSGREGLWPTTLDMVALSQYEIVLDTPLRMAVDGPASQTSRTICYRGCTLIGSCYKSATRHLAIYSLRVIIIVHILNVYLRTYAEYSRSIAY